MGSSKDKKGFVRKNFSRLKRWWKGKRLSYDKREEALEEFCTKKLKKEGIDSNNQNFGEIKDKLKKTIKDFAEFGGAKKIDRYLARYYREKDSVKKEQAFEEAYNVISKYTDKLSEYENEYPTIDKDMSLIEKLSGIRKICECKDEKLLSYREESFENQIIAKYYGLTYGLINEEHHGYVDGKGNEIHVSEHKNTYKEDVGLKLVNEQKGLTPYERKVIEYLGRDGKILVNEIRRKEERLKQGESDELRAEINKLKDEVGEKIVLKERGIMLAGDNEKKTYHTNDGIVDANQFKEYVKEVRDRIEKSPGNPTLNTQQKKPTQETKLGDWYEYVPVDRSKLFVNLKVFNSPSSDMSKPDNNKDKDNN